MSRLLSGRRWALSMVLLGATGVVAEVRAQDTALPAAAQAARAALQRRETKALVPLIAPLRDAVRDRASATTPLLLIWGRTELAAGSPDSAQAAFVAVANGDETPALGVLEQSRMLLVRQLTEGLDLWYLAAEAADPSTWSEIRRDLAPIFSPSEGEAFDALPPGAPRTAWLRAFWAVRDGRDLRNPGDRLLEHYRRLDYARTKFPLPDKRRQYLPGTAYKSDNEDVDDRGVIYLRQGPPTQVVRAGRDGPQNFQTINADGGVPANETWRYASPEGDRFYTFRACATPGPRSLRYVPGNCIEPLDYQLVESVLDVFGPSVTRRVASGRTTIRGRDSLLPSDVELTILARANLDDRFAAILGADRFTLPLRVEEERTAGAADVKVGTTTDSYAHRFAQPMGARIEALTAGREGAQGLVHIAYAIDVLSVTPTKSDDGWLYPVQIRVQLRDSRDSVISALEERRAFRSTQLLGRRETLLGRVALAAPPGTQTLRVVLEHTVDIGTATGPVKIVIPAVKPGILTGGDLILGHSNIALVWLRAPDDSVRFNPTGSFAPVQELELYQELYGLEAGQDYRFELTVSRERDGLLGKVIGGDSKALTLSGEEKAIGPITPVRRFLDISTLEPGRYAVKVEYRAAGAGKLTRSRSFQIRAPR
jgi:GWxTD domain-containing protein